MTTENKVLTCKAIGKMPIAKHLSFYKRVDSLYKEGFGMIYPDYPEPEPEANRLGVPREMREQWYRFRNCLMSEERTHIAMTSNTSKKLKAARKQRDKLLQKMKETADSLTKTVTEKSMKRSMDWLQHLIKHSKVLNCQDIELMDLYIDKLGYNVERSQATLAPIESTGILDIIRQMHQVSKECERLRTNEIREKMIEPGVSIWELRHRTNEAYTELMRLTNEAAADSENEHLATLIAALNDEVRRCDGER